MWIWLAMTDLKAHALHGRSFTIVTGPLLVVTMVLITAITAASLYLNAVFAFAIATPGTPDIGRGRTRAWEHHRVVWAWGTGIGALLAFVVVVGDRWGTRWFSLSLGIVDRRDDGVLRSRAFTPDRCAEEHALTPRPSHRRGRRRRDRCRRLHPAVPPRPPRARHARVIGPRHPRGDPARNRTHAPSRRHKLGEGRQTRARHSSTARQPDGATSDGTGDNNPSPELKRRCYAPAVQNLFHGCSTSRPASQPSLRASCACARTAPCCRGGVTRVEPGR